MPYTPDSYPRQIPQFKVHGRGEVTVSAKGIITGDSNIPNDGADFGPDTMLGATETEQYGPPYSKTNGIQEAFNYGATNSYPVKSTGGRFFVTSQVVIPNDLIFDGIDKNFTIIDGNNGLLVDSAVFEDTSSSTVSSSNISMKNFTVDISSGTGANYYFVIRYTVTNLTLEDAYFYGANTSSGGPPFVIGFNTASSLISQNILFNRLLINANSQTGGNEVLNIGENNYSDVLLKDCTIINAPTAAMTIPKIISATNFVLDNCNFAENAIYPSSANSSLPITVNITIRNSYGILIEVPGGISYMNFTFQNCINCGIAYNPNTYLYSAVFNNCWFTADSSNNGAIINLIVNGGGFAMGIGSTSEGVYGFENNSPTSPVPQWLIFRNVFFGTLTPNSFAVQLFNLQVSSTTYLEISDCMLSNIDTSPYSSGSNSGVNIAINGVSYGQNGISTLAQLAIAKPCITVFRNNHTLSGALMTSTGFGITTPALPAATGSADAVTNTFPFAVRIFQTGESGTHIIDSNGNDVLLPADPAEVTLEPNNKIYYATTVATSWKWYGT